MIAYTVTPATTMKMSVTIASTRNDTSRMANAGVDTGANMLGVAGPAVAIVGLMPCRCRPRGRGDRRQRRAPYFGTVEIVSSAAATTMGGISTGGAATALRAR